MSFSFVSRIIEIEPGRRARGVYVPPPNLAGIPRWLAAEATGQLAGWVALANNGFRRRMVAALVGVVKMGRDSAPGEPLELEVEVHERERATVTYQGKALAGGRSIAEIGRGVAPMLAMEEFDDPGAVSRRLDLLRGEGVVARSFDDPFTHLRIEPLAPPDSEKFEVGLIIPAEAPFFADHFPRRPVLPATLLTETMVRISLELAPHAVGDDPSRLEARDIRHVKVRAFSPPGQVLAVESRLRSVSDDAADFAVTARAGDKIVATAVVELARRANDER
jgi:3-hydroxymyristoyl/3-hydroxydecanoyl-(acyl carrier protein) dehydratase